MHGGRDRRRSRLHLHLITWAVAALLLAGTAPAGAAAAKKKTTAKKPAAAKTKTAAAKPAKKAPAKPKPASAGEEEPSTPKNLTAKQRFADFLHYAKIGRFLEANKNAEALLKLPEAKPDGSQLLALSEEYDDSVETLNLILSSEKLCEDAKLEKALRQSAQQVLERINQQRQNRRSDPSRIKDDIAGLAGEPLQMLNATQRLQWSGEYAVPWMIAALRDQGQAKRHPWILKALPKLGLSAVNPLVMALRIEDDVVKLWVIQALGEIGYAQALPYLKQVAENEKVGEDLRKAATAAMVRIEPASASAPKSAATLFYELALQYYANEGSVRADPREDQSNVWYWRDDRLKADRVPREIFDEIMAMRCCEEALRLEPTQGEAQALWLAANFRREAQLGVVDIASEEPDEACNKDVTRPKGYPRSIYFARSAGPRFNHMVLARALSDHDVRVALGAITALAETAGESSLVGTEDRKQPLVEALTFNSTVVRIRAALALGRALPKTRFAGSQEVIPVLAQALSLTGQRNVIVVDPDAKNLNRVAGILRKADCRAVAEASLPKAIEQAEKDLPTIEACFLASDVRQPDLRGAIAELRKQPGGKNLPVIILTKEHQMSEVELITREDLATGRVLAEHGQERLLGEWDAVSRRVGGVKLNPDLALGLSLAAAQTLRMIVASGSPVYDVGRAESALAAALKHNEADLRVLAAGALALVPTETAQRAIARQALDDGNDDELRIAMFSALAESARHQGSKLEDDQLGAVVRIVMTEKKLPIRTAASQAFGALNVPGNRASEIIRSQYGG